MTGRAGPSIARKRNREVCFQWSQFETLDDVIREAEEELSTYRDILEISDRIKKVEPRNNFPKEKISLQRIIINWITDKSSDITKIVDTRDFGIP